MSQFQNNSIFWVETEKISPNPFQPRKEFDEKSIADLAESIRQYGILQPLVVTRKEINKEDGGIRVEYELIAGERRLRASKVAGLQQVPVIIRSKEDDNKVKLELAIIENVQREDLNPIDRAFAFNKLHKEFKLTHAEIGRKMGKSREYVSNSIRLLALPKNIMQALAEKKITEGHTRPLLMLTDRPEEQITLFKEILLKKMSVRESERVARKVAQDKVRKQQFIIDPRIREIEKKFSENLGTRVHIEQTKNGGKIMIDYFNSNDLNEILDLVKTNQKRQVDEKMDKAILENKKERKENNIDNNIIVSPIFLEKENPDYNLNDSLVKRSDELEDKVFIEKNDFKKKEEEKISLAQSSGDDGKIPLTPFLKGEESDSFKKMDESDDFRNGEKTDATSFKEVLGGLKKEKENDPLKKGGVSNDFTELQDYVNKILPDENDHEKINKEEQEYLNSFNDENSYMLDDETEEENQKANIDLDNFYNNF